MPKQTLRLSPDEKQPRLELEWGGYMRDFHVRLDGKPIEHITGGQRELIKGRKIGLPDGSILSIQLKNMGAMEQLQVLRDGEPLPGSASDPVSQYSAAIRAAFFWGLLSIIAFVASRISGDLDSLYATLTFHPLSYAVGGLLMVAALLLARQSRIAGVLTFGLFILDCVLAGLHVAEADAYVPFITAGALFARVFVLMRLLPALRGIMAR